MITKLLEINLTITYKKREAFLRASQNSLSLILRETENIWW